MSPAATSPPPVTAGQAAADLFGTALGVLLDDVVSPEILHSLVDLAVAMRDHEQAKRASDAR